MTTDMTTTMTTDNGDSRTLFNSIRVKVKRFNDEHDTNWRVSELDGRLSIVHETCGQEQHPTKREFKHYLSSLEAGQYAELKLSEYQDRIAEFSEWAAEVATKRHRTLLCTVTDDALIIKRIA